VTALATSERCVFCGHETSFGSGRFVNRTHVDTSDDSGNPLSGYACFECQGVECDRCGTVTEDYWLVDELDEMLCNDCLEAVKDDLDELPEGYED